MFTKKTLTVLLFTAFVAVGAFSLYMDISDGTFGADSVFAAVIIGLDCQADGGGCSGGGAGTTQVPSDVVAIDSTVDLTGYTFDICADPVFAASFPWSCPGYTPSPAPTCSLNLTKDMISWSTTNANQVLIVPITNSPQIPGLSFGTPTSVTHTESDAYTTPVFTDIAQHGGTTLPGPGIGFAADQTTMNRVCTVLHGANSTALTFGARGYTSPGNNAVVRFNGTSWSLISANSFNSHLSSSFTCSTAGALQSYPFSGYQSFIPPLSVGTHTYQLTANGNGGSKICTATVIVSPTEPDVCSNIPGTQTTVPAGYQIVDGQCVPVPISGPTCTLNLTKDMISWSTSGATTVVISPLTNSPQVPGYSTQGGASVQVSETTIYNSSSVNADLASFGVSTYINATHKAGFAADQLTLNRICSIFYPGSTANLQASGKRGYD